MPGLVLVFPMLPMIVRLLGHIPSADRIDAIYPFGLAVKMSTVSDSTQGSGCGLHPRCRIHHISNNPSETASETAPELADFTSVQCLPHDHPTPHRRPRG